MFLELCLQDGDVETAGVREDREARAPILKVNKFKSKKGKKKPEEDQELADLEVPLKSGVNDTVKNVQNGGGGALIQRNRKNDDQGKKAVKQIESEVTNN